MKDHDSPEAVALRAAQPDPIVMYLIVRETLGMSIGKTAAQCAHASQMLQLKYHEFEEVLSNLKGLDQTFGSLNVDETIELNLFQPKYSVFTEWLATSFRKVVLKADDKEWPKLKEEFKDSMIVVVDAGLTELEPGTETVIGLWPMYKSQCPKLLKKLQALK